MDRRDHAARRAEAGVLSSARETCQISRHCITYGFLAGGLVHRIAGKSIGTFVAERIGAGLQADVFIGVPASERSRISRIIAPKAARPLGVDMDPLARRAVGNPQLSAELPNDDKWIAAEMPALNGHASATGLAKLYGAVANGGHLGPVHLLSRKGRRSRARAHEHATRHHALAHAPGAPASC